MLTVEKVMAFPFPFTGRRGAERIKACSLRNERKGEVCVCMGPPLSTKRLTLPACQQGPSVYVVHRDVNCTRGPTPNLPSRSPLVLLSDCHVPSQPMETWQQRMDLTSSSFLCLVIYQRTAHGVSSSSGTPSVGKRVNAGR